MGRVLKLKKVIPVVVVTTLLCVLLLGVCGVQAAGKPYEIVWYTIGTPQKDIPVVMAELSKYTLKKINATVKMFQYDWGEYNDKMRVIISSGEPYDICFTCSWSNNYDANVTRGAFLPLNDLLQKYGKGITKAVHPLFLEANRIGGKLYAIPVNKELTPQSRWVFNKRLVDKYHIDITKATTLESLEPMLKTVKDGEQTLDDVLVVRNDYNLPRCTADYEFIGPQELGLAVPMGSKDCQVVNYYHEPSFKKGLATVRGYYLAGYLKKDASTLTSSDEVYKTGNWFVREAGWLPGADQIWTRSEKDPVVSTPIAGKFYISANQLSGSMMAISVTSKNPGKAMQFLNLLNTDRYVRNLVDSGIENVHYKMVNGRQVDLERGTGDYNMPSFSLGNRFICNLYTDDPADLWQQYEKLNASGTKSPIIGFKPNLEGIKKEIAAIQNIHAEYYRPLVTGTVDPDE
ncbi:MAG TPA: ABC transporter substrate-binding protein, partial [Bacillota bacterium]